MPYIVIVVLLSYIGCLALLSRPVQLRAGRLIKGMSYDLLLATLEVSPLFTVNFFYSFTPSEFGLSLNSFLPSLFLALLVGIVGVLTQYFLLDARLLVSDDFLLWRGKAKLGHVLRRAAGGLLIFPVSEEILYRGYIQTAFQQYLSFASIFISSILFMVQHYVELVPCLVALSHI